jgi:predicted outer membrane protein
MDKVNFRPAEFAAAYIQTMVHSHKSNEFESFEEYSNYLDERMEYYYETFLEAAKFANDRSTKNLSDDEE